MKTMVVLAISMLAAWLVGGSISSTKRKGRIINTIPQNCIGCRSCIRSCQEKVLEAVTDNSGTHISIAHPEKCKACGHCISSCRYGALEFIAFSGDGTR
ncbi:MAG: 4Fe-4S dicluster domain-containing protein [Clostridium sp.]|nr:4Fe-4S dicluster domain-containing protein [Bacteroides sp.]MCM1198582.1 4Fe-4S dicluster domain-containing protein [Clostridium sp.]